jgi:hypothetical protein
MTLLFHLKFSGVLLIGLGAAHAFFGRYLNWKSDLAKLTPINRQIFVVHCFYIALMLIMLGSLAILFGEPLLDSQPLSRAILAGTTLIWSVRLFLQWTVFHRSLRSSDQRIRVVHGWLTLLWIYLTTVNALALTHVLSAPLHSGRE